MRIRSPLLLAAGLGLTIASAACAQPPATALREIDHLLRYIGNSGCEFKRNDTWNNAAAAEAHVRGKYDVMEKLGMINTTKDFIDKAATQSYFSGQPYAIKCGADVPVPSNFWLNNELARFRALQPGR